jgi:HupE / UreJ protein
VLAVSLGLFPQMAKAHTQSCAYLTIKTSEKGLNGELHLALRDLDDAVDLDVNDDGAITWGELVSRKEAVCAYAASRLHIEEDGKAGVLHVIDFLVDNHSDGAYAVVRFIVEGVPQPRKIQIAYNALFDLDPKHRGLLHLVNNGESRLTVFGPDTSVQAFDLNSTAPATSPFFTFLKQGVWHIWSGYDHILFLLALLLPGVLRRKDGVWLPVTAARPALINILKIVTAFTVAHSITLSLSVLGVVHLPSRLVESAIAASVVLAAFNNLVPFVAERGWMVAFSFGLLHGFGFANALRDLGLQHTQLAATLFGFNFGVEIGQLAIVVVFFPVALALRELMFYQRFVLRFGSVAIMVVSATWLAERVFDFKWLPF